MKRFTIGLFVISLFFCSCSKSDDGSSEIAYRQTDIHITTHQTLAGEESFDGVESFRLFLAGNNDDECLLSHETFVWFDVYTYNSLKFIGPQADSMGRLHVTPENFPVNRWGQLPDYDLCLRLPVGASDEGDYLFVVKLYQPHSGRYYITPPYLMKLWEEGAYLKTEIRQVD